MLKFIFGRPASGKTFTELNIIKEVAEKGEKSVLIVPEQFSFESEKSVLQTLGDKNSRLVDVMSFSRICDEVGRNIGNISSTPLTDSDKIIFMNRALISVSNDLKLWSKYTHSIKFAQTMLDAIGEFKLNAIDVSEIKDAMEKTDTVSLKNKLFDISLIYEAYDMLLGEKFLDPIDNLTKLYYSLEDYRYFENKTVFIDSFKGFTGQQYKIINRILTQSKDLYIAFTNDVTLTKEFNVYSNIRTAIKDIEASAKKYNVHIENPLILKDSRYNNKSLESLERLISGGKIQEKAEDNAITICNSISIYDEAEFAVRTIRRLVRTENYRYRDFVIIARDADIYEDAIAKSVSTNKIKCFWDKRVPLTAFPMASLIDSAILFLTSSPSENILRFYKTGLAGLTYDEISLLDNYVYLWNIDSTKWNEEWEMNPNGFTNSELKDREKLTLKKINALREKAIKPLNKFKKKFVGNAQEMTTAIVNMLEYIDVKTSLLKLKKAFIDDNNEFSSDVLIQSYDEYMSILDSIVRCFGDKTMTKKEYYEALKLAVSMGSVGVIPQTLDEVIFGSADRIRPSRPKIAFILGSNQGIFPQNISNSGIFASNERKSLIELNLKIPDKAIYSAIDENYLVYCNLCCPSEKLYISYSEYSISGEALEPSVFVTEILENINVTKIHYPETDLSDRFYPETEESAFSEYCQRFNRNVNDAESLKQSLVNGQLKERLFFVENNLIQSEMKIDKENAEKLYGDKLYMSASKIDVFSKCHFEFFCKYGLNTTKLQPAEFDAMQRGTIVHYVLEQIMNKYQDSVKSLSEEEITEEINYFINQYLDSIKGYRSTETARQKFLVSKISRLLKDVVVQISNEFKQNQFSNVGCEVGFGKDKQYPPLEIKLDENKEIIINGSIDRVDKYNQNVRIVDYKTGTKSFKLPDILYGLNMQMLIYLYALLKFTNDKTLKPSGILYMPSKRNLDENGLAMNGLLVSDADVLHAMESNTNGEFIPKFSVDNEGKVKSRSNSFLDYENFDLIFNCVEKQIINAGKKIFDGKIDINPVDGRETGACKYCDYKSVCRIENKKCFAVPSLSNDDVIKKIKEDEANGI